MRKASSKWFFFVSQSFHPSVDLFSQICKIYVCDVIIYLFSHHLALRSSLNLCQSVRIQETQRRYTLTSTTLQGLSGRTPQCWGVDSHMYQMDVCSLWCCTNRRELWVVVITMSGILDGNVSIAGGSTREVYY